ncbi:hypothetical protein ACFW7J_17985, partial [Streptomyces sp. NPDC059525]
MRTFAQRLLLPGLTTLALAAAGCSSPAHTGSAGPGAAPGAPAAGGSQQLEVAAAPQGSAGPTPLARTSTGEGRPEKSSLRVASYDKGSQRAVTAPAPAPKPPKGSQNSPSDGPPAPAKPVAVGDVIASAPAPGAPDGLLAKVTEVVGKTDRGTEVKTAPTTLSAALGEAKADGKVKVDPSAMTVEPLMKGVTFSWA